MRFEDLSTQAQVHRLRRVAAVALERYPIEVRRLRLLNHDFNTTFRIDTSTGEKYALRIDLNRRKPTAALDAEMAWLAALATEADIVVPQPLGTLDGALHTAVGFPELDRPLNVAVMSWLPGRDLDVPTVPTMHELGRVMAALHRHAAGWSIPAGVEFPVVDGVFMDSSDRLPREHALIDECSADVLAKSLELIEPTYEAMVSAGTRIPIHGDLHQWNVKWLRGRMSVFDFDDAGIGVPAQDLAITSYYLSAGDELRAALFEGYQTNSPLPPLTDEQLQAALAARNLILLSDVLGMSTRSARDMAEHYLNNTLARLRSYLDTGTYRMDAPGVVPLN